MAFGESVSDVLTHPGAAASLRAGLAETLTLQRLGVGGALYRTLRSTNAIENLNGLVGRFVRNVRRWRDGGMLMRWIATGLQDAQRRFRSIRGCGEMPALIQALDRHHVDTKKAVASTTITGAVARCSGNQFNNERDIPQRATRGNARHGGGRAPP